MWIKCMVDRVCMWFSAQLGANAAFLKTIFDFRRGKPWPTGIQWICHWFGEGLKSTGSLCCGVWSERDHSIVNSGMIARLLLPTAMFQTDRFHITLSSVKNPPPPLRCGLSSSFFDHLFYNARTEVILRVSWTNLRHFQPASRTLVLLDLNPVKLAYDSCRLRPRSVNSGRLLMTTQLRNQPITLFMLVAGNLEKFYDNFKSIFSHT